MTPTERLGYLLTKELLEALDAMYPPKAPDPKDSDREIWLKAGERRLIDTLHLRHAHALEDMAERHVVL